jgi:hypothetical protein
MTAYSHTDFYQVLKKSAISWVGNFHPEDEDARFILSEIEITGLMTTASGQRSFFIHTTINCPVY